MAEGDTDLNRRELEQSVRHAIAGRGVRVPGGYQSNLYVAQVGGRRILIKTIKGWFLTRWLRRLMLAREFRVYQHLSGFSGVPRCLGFLDGKYLLLEFVDGVTLRHSEVADRERFFERLLTLIRQLHDRGVAHGDLKRKDNLLVVNDSQPVVIDFGVASIRKPGFAPINHFIFRTLERFDLNAWAKLKCRRRYENLSPRDAQYYQPTLVERLARGTKRAYLFLRHRT